MEFKRVLKNKLNFCILIFIVGAGVFGILNYSDVLNYARNSTPDSLILVLASSKVMAFIGSVIFALYTLLIFDEDDRKETKCILETTPSYNKHILMRVLAIIVDAFIGVFMALIVVGFVQVFKFDTQFSLSIYLYNYFLVALLPIIYSILICAGFYMIFNNMIVSVFGYIASFVLSAYSQNYLMNWILPNQRIDVYSDFAGMEVVSKYIIYSKFLWLFIAGSIFVFGILSKRAYDFNIIKSFVKNSKRYVIMPVVLVLMIGFAVLIYTNEPYIFNEKYSDSVYLDKNIRKLPEQDYRNTKLKGEEGKIYFDTQNSKINAELKYYLRIGENCRYIYFEANAGIKPEAILLNNKACDYKRFRGRLIRVKVLGAIKNKMSTLKIKYSGTIKSGDCSGDLHIAKNSIYLLEGHGWLVEPICEYTKGKRNLSVELPKNLVLISDGDLKTTKVNGNRKQWQYQTNLDVPVGMFASNYKRFSTNINGLKVNLFFVPKHEEAIKRCKLKNYIREMISYYQAKIGQCGFKELPMNIVETSVHKPGGHSTFNVVTVCEYIFNQKKGLNEKCDYEFHGNMDILAHEIAHQWWGKSVKSVDGKSSFSDEGWAQYWCMKYLKNKFPSYVKEQIGNWKMDCENINDFLKDVRDYVNAYEKMSFELFNMEKRIGERKFERKVKGIYEKHKEKSLNVSEFYKCMGVKKGDYGIE